ncbi:hypothetical protein Fcan01_21914 [Folsomia candida]|uniref:Uncharacterized protein n=1 Tax=Folsomia candida TaxID=158441 RepID=A0A226DC01_FOLCA|nr:hypothetical protein Fcan01_21914 [Folsomia candida]
MVSLHFGSLLAHLLVSISICLSSTEATTNVNDKAAFGVRIPEYLSPFGSCTTMVFTRPKLSWGTKSPTHGPIITLVYDIRTSLMTGDMLQTKFSIARRRNPRQHCWTAFAVLPEDFGLFVKQQYSKFAFLPCFIYATWEAHYFVMMTGVRHTGIYLRRPTVLKHLCLIEVIIVDVTKDKNSLLRFDYHNVYHIERPIMGMGHSQLWYRIECIPSDCFYRFALLGKNVSRLNKYFWTAEDLFGKNILGGIVNQIQIGRKAYTRCACQRIADLTSFHGFLSYLILQDVLTDGFVKPKSFHYIEPTLKMHFWRFEGFGFIMNDVEKFSFVSCYGVRGNSAILGALSSPLDFSSWACTGISFAVVVLILTSILRRYISDAVLLVVGITLENSSLLSVYETRFSRKVYPTFGICTVVAIWTILVGTILTNWYKTWFTMEMIVPTIYESPWESVMDVEGIRILMPFGLLWGNAFDGIHPVEYFRYKSFYVSIILRCETMRNYRGNGLLQGSHRKTANNLLEKLLPHFGMDNKLRTVRNGTFSRKGSLNEPYDKSALLEFPIQPVEYEENDSYAVMKSLKTCGKVALMDTQENIAKITNYLNDNQQQVTFVKGDGDSFFTEMKGWNMPPVRSNYVENRLKVFISSGIMIHWKVVYNLWRPAKLLGYNTNWLGAVSRLDFSSKITTGFYIYGIGLILCIVVLFVEICKLKYNMKFNYMKFLISTLNYMYEKIFRRKF